jgi:hypothetical protein
MSSDRPSSPRKSSSQLVNPYAASRVPDARTESGPTVPEEATRNYQARMDWVDRRAFLRSVGPTRIGSIFAGLVWLKICFEWTAYLVSNQLSDSETAVTFVLGLMVLAQGVIVLYACWLDWNYADALRDVAGGGTSSMRGWSRLHYRTAWLWAASALLSFANELGMWLSQQSVLWLTV